MYQIGGPFSEADRKDFLLNRSSSQDTLFPRKNRSFAATGSDALAIILISMGIKRNDTILLPKNYCYESWNRTADKLISAIGFAPRLFSYDSLNDVSGDSRSKILLISYYNKYDKRLFTDARKVFPRDLIIEDFVQCPFEINKARAPYAFNSLRKFFPIEISICYGGKNIRNLKESRKHLNLMHSARKSKSIFLRNPTPENEMKFLKSTFAAENFLKNQRGIFLANRNEIKLFHRIDFKRILKRRIQNFSYLKKALRGSKANILPGSYTYFILRIRRRDEMRKELANDRIFCAIHWPDSKSPISQELISIPIDQRYNKKDMQFLAKKVRAYLKNPKPLSAENSGF